MERPDTVTSTAALVVAAGLSSRMEKFKPFLELGDKTIIEWVVETLQSAGISKIVLVTGFRAAEMEQMLSGRGLIFARNEHYTDTQMFESVKIGLQVLEGQCGRFFILPGDLPLFRRYTLESILSAQEKTSAGVVIPSFSGKRGHPILVSENKISQILEYDGPSGLKGALSSLTCLQMELAVPDPGILLDADTPDDYAGLKRYRSEMDYPSPEVCHAILQWFNADERIEKHGRAVADAALEIADKLSSAGYILNRALLESSALLHDVARNRTDHARCGSDWMIQLGYQSVAEVVAAHMDVPEQAIDRLDESAIVYLADKLVVEDRRVPLEERFMHAQAKYADDPKAAEAVRTRLDKAQRIINSIESRMAGSKDRYKQ